MAESWSLAGGYAVAPAEAGDAERAVAFWAREGVLSPRERRRRAGEVIVRATGPDGQLVGVGTAHLGHASPPGLPLWFYRTFVAREHRRSAVAVELALAARDEMAARFAAGDERAAGVAWDLQNRALARAWPQADWHLVGGFLYVGRSLDGDDLRVCFFPGARAPLPPPVAEPVTLPGGQSVALLLGHDSVTREDVVAFWVGQGVLSAADAWRRVSQVLLVATDAAGAVAAVGTVYLGWQEQLRAEMWHYRTFVGPEHRGGALALTLSAMTHAHLEARWAAGVDRRAPGVVFEVQNEGLRRHFADAVWPRTQMAFLTRRSDADVRVRWFPGALAPPPPD